MSRNTKWSDEILNILAFILVVKFFSCSTDNLEDDLYSAIFCVATSNSQWDSLTILVYTKDDELTWLSLCGYERCLDFHLSNSWIQILFSYNLVHNRLSIRI